MNPQNPILKQFNADAANAFREFLDARPGENMIAGHAGACMDVKPKAGMPTGPTVMDLMQGLSKGISEAHENLSTLQDTIGPVTLPPTPNTLGGCAPPEAPMLSPAGEELINLIRGISELNRRMRATIQGINL